MLRRESASGKLVTTSWLLYWRPARLSISFRKPLEMPFRRLDGDQPEARMSFGLAAAPLGTGSDKLGSLFVGGMHLRR